MIVFKKFYFENLGLDGNFKTWFGINFEKNKSYFEFIGMREYESFVMWLVWERLWVRERGWEKSRNRDRVSVRERERVSNIDRVSECERKRVSNRDRVSVWERERVSNRDRVAEIVRELVIELVMNNRGWVLYGEEREN